MMQDPVDKDALVVKFKRLYLSSSAEFRDQENAHKSQTGEGTESAADWCSEDSRSKVSVMWVGACVLCFFVCVPREPVGNESDAAICRSCL